MVSNVRDIRAFLGRLADSDAVQRGLAADGVVDWPESLDQDAGAVLSRLLEVAVLLEDADGALESYLHALAELAEWDLVPLDVLQRVPECKPWGQPWAADYVEYIRERAVDFGGESKREIFESPR